MEAEAAETANEECQETAEKVKGFRNYLKKK